MAFRRLVRQAVWPMALVLPVWLLVANGIVHADSGWAFLAYLVIAPITFVLLAIVAALTWFRSAVRRDGAVSVADAVVLPLWWLAILVHGFTSSEALQTATAIVGVLLGLIAFWSAVAQLLQAARSRMDEFSAQFGADRVPGDTSTPGPRLIDNNGVEVIRIDPPTR